MSGELPDTFDEDNEILMKYVAEEVGLLVPEVFASTLEDVGAKLVVDVAHQVEWTELSAYLDLINTTLGATYEAVDGPDWTLAKRQEMQECGLVYVSYKKSDKVVGFVSMRLVMDYGLKKLYLYEIHVDPQYQGHGIGKKLMEYVHQLSDLLSQYPEPLKSTGVSLTVFADNTRAYQMYQSLGYHLTDNSPTDKQLRGKIIRPVFYLMTRVAE